MCAKRYGDRGGGYALQYLEQHLPYLEQHLPYLEHQRYVGFCDGLLFAADPITYTSREDCDMLFGSSLGRGLATNRASLRSIID